jgi:hypothetical protein
MVDFTLLEIDQANGEICGRRMSIPTPMRLFSTYAPALWILVLTEPAMPRLLSKSKRTVVLEGSADNLPNELLSGMFGFEDIKWL